jgi:hypothetical protein
MLGVQYKKKKHSKDDKNRKRKCGEKKRVFDDIKE